MTDKAVTAYSLVTPNSGDSVLGEQNGLVKRFAVSDLVAGEALGDSGGAGLVGFDKDEAYDSGTVGAKLAELAKSVMDNEFGAVGDGTTDDGAAINLATAWLRSQIATAGGNHAIKLIFPSGYTFKTTIPLDFTDIRQSTSDGFWSVEGHGATISGHCTGKPVMDFMRSLGGCLRGLHVVGDSTNRPRHGIQLARGTTGESADAFSLEHCKIEGYYTVAPFYNMSSERFIALHCTFRNDYAAAECFAAVIDGRNKYEAVSDYYSTTIAAETAQSCLSHLFLQCTFYNGGSGPAVFMTRASRVRVLPGYAVSVDSVGVRIGLDTNPVRDLVFDLHMETTGTLTSAVEFTSEGGATAGKIRGFELKENAANATNSLFKATGVTVKLTDFKALIGSYNIVPTTTFDGTFTVHGEFNDPAGPVFGSTEIFTGSQHVANYSLVGYRFTKGSYTVTDEQSGDRVEKGTIRQYGATADTFAGNTLATKQMFKDYSGKRFFGVATGTAVCWEWGLSNGEAPLGEFGTINNGYTGRFRVDNGSGMATVLTINPAGNGNIQLPRLSADPASNNTGGDIYYNTTTHKFRGYIGGGTAAWVDLN